MRILKPSIANRVVYNVISSGGCAGSARELVVDMTTRRVQIKGLRDADIATLRVLTQDVLALPLNQIDASTFCDLVALSELKEGLPNDLSRELNSFRESRFRELGDLPDGPVLAEWLGTLIAVAAAEIPQAVRDAVTALVPERTEAESVEALEKATAHAGSVEPAVVSLNEAAEEASMAEEAVKERTPAKKKKAPAKRKSAAAQKDPARAEWIEEYMLTRLVNYETGLKEAVLVGGTRFKSPWKDMTDKEIRAVLRRMGREGKVRTTVGRWLIER
jgi:hypothetical protein